MLGFTHVAREHCITRAELESGPFSSVASSVIASNRASPIVRKSVSSPARFAPNRKLSPARPLGRQIADEQLFDEPLCGHAAKARSNRRMKMCAGRALR